jgi:hypothetical protein
LTQQKPIVKRRLYPILGLLGLALGLLLLLAQGVYADFPHTTDVRLSNELAACNAVRPHLARNQDGDWIAVGWIQENPKQEGGCFANGGRAFLRWATEEETFSGWRGPVALESPETGGCINHVDVALRGTTAHLVLTSQAPCENTSKSGVYYTTCDLNTGNCQALSQIVAIDSPGTGVRFLEAYIAVDDANKPHIVYSRRDILHDGDDWERPSQIFYARRDTTGAWKTRSFSDEFGAYEPRIAWDRSPSSGGQGYVHVVWESHLSEGNDYGRVHYRRCDDNKYLSGGQIDCPAGNPFYVDPVGAKTYPRPAVGVSGDRVTLIWNYCTDIDGNEPCEKFALFYRRSDGTGTNFPAVEAKEVRTNRGINQPLHHYDGTDDEEQEYMYLPRPAVEMNAAGAPVVAWQIQDPSLDHVYALSTTWAISASTSIFNWEETGWSSGEGSDTRVSPDIALPDPEREPQGLHMVFMRRRGLYNKFQVYYSYFGTELYATPTPTATPRGEDLLKVYLPLVCRRR